MLIRVKKAEKTFRPAVAPPDVLNGRDSCQPTVLLETRQQEIRETVANGREFQQSCHWQSRS
jgi:hypothetical protein